MKASDDTRMEILFVCKTEEELDDAPVHIAVFDGF
jgi:hypothetical protein